MPAKTAQMTGFEANCLAAADHFIACRGSKPATRIRARFDRFGSASVSFLSFESDTRHQGDRIWQRYTATGSSGMLFALRSPVARHGVRLRLIWGLGIPPLANGFGHFPRNPRFPRRTPSFCARTNACAKRTAFSGFEPEKKTVRGTVFPAIEYIAEYRGVLTRGHLCSLMGVSERGLHA